MTTTYKNGVRFQEILLDSSALNCLLQYSSRGESELYLAGQVDSARSAVIGAREAGTLEGHRIIEVMVKDPGGSLEDFFRSHRHGGDGVHVNFEAYWGSTGNFSLRCKSCDESEFIKKENWSQS